VENWYPTIFLLLWIVCTFGGCVLGIAMYRELVPLKKRPIEVDLAWKAFLRFTSGKEVKHADGG
jgi:hypothetical protein